MVSGWQRGLVLAALVGAVALGVQPRPTQAQSAAALEPSRTIDRAEALVEGHQYLSAHNLIVPWLLANPKAPDRPRALYLLAQLYYHTDERIRAFYHLDELMDNFPDSKLFFPALELQYQIADGYLDGYKELFLGMRIIPQYDEAIEMLFRIQERSPGSPLAERALKRSADYYFNTSQFDLATDAYGAFIRGYPRSPEIPRVRLRQAFSSLAQFRGPRFDATPLIDARARFKEIQALYPDLAADANVAGWIERIDTDLARKAYTNADFYRRTNNPTGAVYLYRYVIQTYPTSREAELARRDLATLPAAALAGPPPTPITPDTAAQPTPQPPQSTQRPQ